MAFWDPGAAPGGSSTLATAYDNTPADNTITLSSAGGPVIIQNTGAAIGNLLQVKGPSSSTVLTLTDNGSITLQCQQATGAANVNYILDNANVPANTQKMLSMRGGGTEAMNIQATSSMANGIAMFSGSARLDLNNTFACRFLFTQNIQVDSTGLTVVGALKLHRSAVADANFTTSAGVDFYVSYTSITAARTVTLTTGGTATQPLNVVVKDESGNASGVNTITCTPSSGTIDGAANKVVNTAFGVLRAYCNGTNWFTW